MGVCVHEGQLHALTEVSFRPSQKHLHVGIMVFIPQSTLFEVMSDIVSYLTGPV